MKTHGSHSARGLVTNYHHLCLLHTALPIPAFLVYLYPHETSFKPVSRMEADSWLSHSLPYKTHKIDIMKNEQKTPEFLAINPNGRIPALTDTFSDGKLIRLFESGSIMRTCLNLPSPW